MLYNDLKIALRMFWRQRLYVVLNVIGLATGLTCMILAFLYINDEYQFDDFHTANPHLYRITTTYTENRGGERERSGGTGQIQGPTFAANVPEVKQFARVMGGDIYEDVRVDSKALKLQPLYVDDSFFQVFSFRLLHGDPRNVLAGVNSVVVSEQTARKLFNSTDVVGKLIHLDADPSAQRLGNKPLVITGVVETPPAHSSIQFDLLHPFRFMQLSFDDTNWLNAYLGTFVVLHPKADVTAVSRKFNQLYRIHARQQLVESRRNENHDPQISYGLQAMTDIHLNPLYNRNSGREGGVINGSSPVFSYLFLGIASFILLMASINFVNISIGSALKRTKEVGIRKVTGGRRSQLIGQFLGESTVLCGVAFGLSLLVIEVTLPTFNQLAGKAIVLKEALSLPLWLGLMGLFVINVLLSGFYPAYILSKVNPTAVLYQRQRVMSRHGFGRGLVVVQFTLAVSLLISTLVFRGQMDYIRTKDLGYSPYQVVRTYISGNRELKPIADYIQNEVAHVPSILQISFGEEWGIRDVEAGGRTISGLHNWIDRNYLSVNGIRLRSGRNILSEKAEEALVNEAFVKAAGLTNPLRATVQLGKDLGGQRVNIVGVIRNFHANSLKERIKPMLFLPNNGKAGGIWFKVDKNRQAEALAAFEEIYKKAVPGGVYEYAYLDELKAREYAQEQRWEQVISYASILSLLVCAMGLFGLAHLSTTQRMKEISIRKVLGASVSNITLLLSKEFFRLVLLAILIATPLAWYVMEQWLENFAYRIAIDWSLFVFAGGVALSIAGLTVSFHTFRVSMMNPARNLRAE